MGAARELIRKWEGCKLRAYQDGGGVWTIGYGHTANVTEGMEWTQDQADEALIHDLKIAEMGALKHITSKTLSANQIAALTSFVFNLGVGNFSKSKLLTHVNAGAHVEAALELLQWHHIGKTKSRGLLRRRLDEAALYLA